MVRPTPPAKSVEARKFNWIFDQSLKPSRMSPAEAGQAPVLVVMLLRSRMMLVSVELVLRFQLIAPPASLTDGLAGIPTSGPKAMFPEYVVLSGTLFTP